MADYPAHQVPLEQSASWSTVSVQVGSIRWICLSGFHTRLSSPHAPDWLDLAAAGAELVKSSPVRQVYRVAWDDREYFVKIYRPAGIYGHIRRLLRPCPAQVEFGHLQIARSRSVPAVKPLAWGRRTTPGRAWAALITESIGPTESLDEILWREPPVPEDLRLEALAVAARLLGRLHCAGILHADLHPGNVLLKSAAAKGMDSEGGISERTAADRDETVGQTPLESEPQTACLLEAYISDLQTARFEPRGGHASADPFQRRRMRNAAVLYAGLRHRAGEQGLDHFLREYIRTMQPTRRGWPDDPVRLRRRLERLGDRHDRRVWAGRDRRALRNSRFTRQIGLAGGWRAYVYLQAKRPLPYSPASTMQLSPEQWRIALAEPGRLNEPGRCLKQGSCHTVMARTLELAGRKLPVVAKHSRLRP
ncbi:MAG: hypothetical protein JW810_12640, partial [Sedimentisphaerales bacterium]|nr:hypothetical protein [Sedimentisphaerales bacterium]